MGNKSGKEASTPKPVSTPTGADTAFEDGLVFTPATTPTDLTPREADANRRRRVMSVTNLFTDISQYYKIEHKELGHGKYGIVRRAVDKLTKEKVAVKSIFKQELCDIESLKTELNIIRNLNHPNIVRYITDHEDDRYLHIVMELCEGGELFDKLLKKDKFDEFESANLMRDIFSAVCYCHEKDIVHRDLKPENFLYLTKKDDSPIKIIDFGLSKIYVYLYIYFFFFFYLNRKLKICILKLVHLIT